jgi:hypothetical protein
MTAFAVIEVGFAREQGLFNSDGPNGNGRALKE